MLNLSELLIVLVVALTNIFQLIIQLRMNRRIEHEVARLNREQDQKIQRLHRIRKAVIRRQMAHVYVSNFLAHQQEPNETYFQKRSETEASFAEIRGLAFAIGDDELKQIVNSGITEGHGILSLERLYIQSQQLHTRISQLLEAETRT